MNVLTNVVPGNSPNSSFSSARRYLARIFVAASTSAMSIFWRMRASRNLSPMDCTAAHSGERRPLAWCAQESSPRANGAAPGLGHGAAATASAAELQLQQLRRGLVARGVGGDDPDRHGARLEPAELLDRPGELHLALAPRGGQYELAAALAALGDDRDRRRLVERELQVHALRLAHASLARRQLERGQRGRLRIAARRAGAATAARRRATGHRRGRD